VEDVRRLVTLAVGAVLAACSTIGPPSPGVEVRFVISSSSIAADGSRRTQTYENAVLAASGEAFERELGQQYRVSLMSHIEGDSVRVQFAAFDLTRNVQAGTVTTLVTLGGQSEVALGSSGNHQYRVLLKARKRDLPRPAA